MRSRPHHNTDREPGPVGSAGKQRRTAVPRAPRLQISDTSRSQKQAIGKDEPPPATADTAPTSAATRPRACARRPGASAAQSARDRAKCEPIGDDARPRCVAIRVQGGVPGAGRLRSCSCERLTGGRRRCPAMVAAAPAIATATTRSRPDAEGAAAVPASVRAVETMVIRASSGRSLDDASTVGSAAGSADRGFPLGLGRPRRHWTPHESFPSLQG